MLRPKDLYAVFWEHSFSQDADGFIKVHRHLEGYLKRLLLIGLRLHRAQWKAAELVVVHIHADINALFQRCVVLLAGEGTDRKAVLRSARCDSADLFACAELVFEFSSRFRNRLVHGVIGKMYGEDTLATLIETDLRFVQLFEHRLQTLYGRSALDSPTAWGATRGAQESPEALIKRVGVGGLSKAPIKLEDARKRLEGLPSIPLVKP